MGGRLRVVFVVIACVLAWVTPAGAASWSPPVTLWTATDPSVSSDIPIVAIDDAGYGVALVPEQGNGSASLHSFEHVPGGTWQESPGALLSGPVYGAAVAIDPAGNAIAVWAFGPLTATTIESATWNSATARWSPAQMVATSPGAQAQFFSASANAAGQIVVAWESEVNGALSVNGMVGSTSGGFSAAVRVATLPAYHRAYAFSTAIGPAGDAAIQWTEDDGGFGGSEQNIEVAVRPAGGDFALDAATPITDLRLPSSALGGQVAVDAAGDVLSTFFMDQGTTSLASSYRPAGGTFGPAQQVASRNDNANSQDIVVAFDSAGNATIAWVALVLTGDLLNPPVVLESAARPPGPAAAWGQAVQLTDPIAGIASVGLSEAADGSAILAPVTIGANADAADLIFTRSAGGSFVADGDPGGCVDSFVAMAPHGDAALGCWSNADRSEQLLVRDVHGPSLAKLQTPAVAVAGAPASFAVAVSGWAQLVGGQPSWSFGDGTSGAGTAVRHTYAKAGNFTIAVTATDADGSAPAHISRHLTVLPRGTILVGLGSARISGKRLTVHGTASGRGTITLTLRRRARRHALTVARLALRGGGWTRSLRLPTRLPRGTYDVVASGAKVRGSKTSFRLG